MKIARIVFSGHINVNAEIDITTNFYRAADNLAAITCDEDRRIEFLFSSWGGSIDCGISLCNKLMAIPYQIDCYNTGTVESIAIPIFMAATNRIACPCSKFMTHPYIWPVNGLSDVNVGICNEFIDKINHDQKRVVSYLHSRGLQEDAINEIFSSTTIYRSPEWAKFRGVADKIMEVPKLDTSEIISWAVCTAQG